VKLQVLAVTLPALAMSRQRACSQHSRQSIPQQPPPIRVVVESPQEQGAVVANGVTRGLHHCVRARRSQGCGASSLLVSGHPHSGKSWWWCWWWHCVGKACGRGQHRRGAWAGCQARGLASRMAALLHAPLTGERKACPGTGHLPMLAWLEGVAAWLEGGCRRARATHCCQSPCGHCR
jgi:hypothetical protein